MESMSKQPHGIHVDIHYGELKLYSILGKTHLNHPHIAETLKLDPTKNIYDDYHKFAIEREGNVVRWLIDDIVYKTVKASEIGRKNWVFDEKFHFLLNVAGM